MGAFTHNTARYRETQLNKLSAQPATRILLLIYVMQIHPTVGKFYVSSVLQKINSNHTSNHYFSIIELSSYYSSVTSYHPPCSKEMLCEILSLSGGPSECEFTFRPVENTEVPQMMLKCLPKARGYSCDGISLCYFKDLLSAIVPFFTNLFNQSIETCNYPNIW